MAKFILSGFADEIDPMLDAQIEGLRRLQIHHLEIRAADGKNIADFSPAEAKALRGRLDDAGIAVSAIGSPIGKIGIEEPFAPHLERFKNVLEIAQLLSAPYIRLFSFFMPEGEDPELHAGEVLRRMGAFVDAARGSCVVLLHENEKAIYGDVPSRCLTLLKAFPGELFATYDPSNFVQCGVSNLLAFEALLPYVRYVHMKDSLAEDQMPKRDHGAEGVSDAHRPVGLGDGELEYILHRLRDENYEGFLSIEPHLSATNLFGETGFERFATATKALRSLLAGLG
ncbi:MAG: sugar phosphate isomerase/epimerase [Christensenellaceae bacterium]|jgi:sugar phosphate isomerase/epimerase|nr:sugar phosphate isomerase/epimerase [Christensenellaceae bacterium]